MTASDATRLARHVVADLTGADDSTKLLGAVLLLLADEVDRLAEVVERLARRGSLELRQWSWRWGMRRFGWLGTAAPDGDRALKL